MIRPPPTCTRSPPLFPSTTLFRSEFNPVLPRLQSRGLNRPILFAVPLRQGLYDCGSTVLQIKAPAAKPTAIRDQNARLGRLRHLYVGSQPEWKPGEGRRRMKGHAHVLAPILKMIAVLVMESGAVDRSEERRVGKEGVRTGRCREAP